jgi:hypothetical protein
MGLSSHIGCPGREGTEARSEENADILYVDGEVKSMQSIVDDAAGRHKTRINCAADNSAQWVPYRGVKPVPEFLQRCQQTNSTRD